MGAVPLGPTLSHSPRSRLLCGTWVSGSCSLTLSFPSFAPHLSPHPLMSPLHTHLCVSLSGCCAPCLQSPSAPSSSSSAKGGGAPWPGGAQTYSPSSTCRYRSLAQPATATARLSSISSHDSGFVSQDATYSKPPSPMPSDITSQVRGCQQDQLGVGCNSLMTASGYLHVGPPTAVDTGWKVSRATTLGTSLSSLPQGQGEVGRCWSSQDHHSSVSRGLCGPHFLSISPSLPPPFFRHSCWSWQLATGSGSLGPSPFSTLEPRLSKPRDWPATLLKCGLSQLLQPR